MPELPEVETVRRGLEPLLLNADIVGVQLNRGDLRFAFPAGFADVIAGQRVLAVRRRAKYLLVDLSGGQTLIIHLGMSGRFRVIRLQGQAPLTTMYHSAGDIAAHDHVVFSCAGPSGSFELVYNDARRFGFMDLCETDRLARHPFFVHLGLEPLSNEMNAKALISVLHCVRTAMKGALLDQRRIAGLGNIYVSEALFRVGVSPWMIALDWAEAARRTPSMAEDLASAIRTTLERALQVGGSTLRDHRTVSGENGGFQHEFLVYGREGSPCLVCGTPIARKVQGGRSTFYCPSCQKVTHQN